MAFSTASGTAAGSVTEPSSVHQVPPSNLSVVDAATCSANLVLPTPPEPTRVIRRSALSSWAIRSTSPCRPTSGVRGAARDGGGKVELAARGLADAARFRRRRWPAPLGRRELRPRASAISVTVDRRGARRRPCSKAAMVSALTRARSARASWVRPAATLKRRSRSPTESATATTSRSHPRILAFPSSQGLRGWRA